MTHGISDILEVLLLGKEQGLVRWKTAAGELILESDIDVVGEAGDGRGVLDVVHETNPDVLLLDLRMPNLDGLGALETLQQTNKRTRVIILTASEDKNEFVQAMKLGCSGIVLKQTAPDLIVKSIRKVHSVVYWFAMLLLTKQLPKPSMKYFLKC